MTALEFADIDKDMEISAGFKYFYIFSARIPLGTILTNVEQNENTFCISLMNLFNT